MPLKAICMSHSPFIGRVSAGEAVERDVQNAIAQLADEVAAFAPELVIMLAPDHFNGFFYDIMPAFCVGVRAQAIGDYGTPSGALRNDEDKAIALVEAMSEHGFDLAASYRMQVDHAFAQPLAALTGSLDRYPVVPVFINAAAPPRPSMKRVRQFGAALGAFAMGTGQRVLLIGSGGLSHDPPVPSIRSAPPEVQETLIAGRNPSADARKQREARTLQAGQDFAAKKGNLRELNDGWDRTFLSVLQSADMDAIDRYSDGAITEEAGRAGHEVRTWVAALAAQAAAGPYKMDVVYQRPIPEWIVGMAMAKAETAKDMQ
jgi:2,3-dihydroxyphenylpropionate 1,2-dioxygenase